MLKLRFEIAFASLQAHPPEQSFDPVCCPLPPVCQPQPRMKRFAGKHILVPSLLWAGQGLRGEAAESSRTRSAFPRFLPASAAESSPAFPPLPPSPPLPSARLQAWRKHILKEDPSPGTLLREDPVSFYRVVWENLITRLEKTDACLPLVLPVLPVSALLF